MTICSPAPAGVAVAAGALGALAALTGAAAAIGTGKGAIGLALFYVVGSVVFSILGLFAGLALMRHLA